MEYLNKQYKIEIFKDYTFTNHSVDNFNHYDSIYLEESQYLFPSIYGIKVCENDRLIKSAVIGSSGGGTMINATSAVIENDKILICCSDTIFCLSIPELSLLWRTQADNVTCFEVYKYEDCYIIHGEAEISLLNKEGKILWQFGGADIFVAQDGTQGFELNDENIIVKDWDNSVYTLDYNGKVISYQKANPE